MSDISILSTQELASLPAADANELLSARADHLAVQLGMCETNEDGTPKQDAGGEYMLTVPNDWRNIVGNGPHLLVRGALLSLERMFTGKANVKAAGTASLTVGFAKKNEETAEIAAIAERVLDGEMEHKSIGQVITKPELEQLIASLESLCADLEQHEDPGVQNLAGVMRISANYYRQELKPEMDKELSFGGGHFVVGDPPPGNYM